MKKILFSVAIILTAANLFAQSVKFSSAMPLPGQALTFDYDPTGGKLAMLTNLKCVAYTFINNKVKPVNVPLTKEGTIYRGSFVPADSTVFAFVTFNAEGTNDESEKGYYTHFYQNGKTTPLGNYWEGMYWSLYGPRYAGIKADKAKSVE
jgi:hypothetical protein